MLIATAANYTIEAAFDPRSSAFVRVLLPEW